MQKREYLNHEETLGFWRSVKRRLDARKVAFSDGARNWTQLAKLISETNQTALQRGSLANTVSKSRPIRVSGPWPSAHAVGLALTTDAYPECIDDIIAAAGIDLDAAVSRYGRDEDVAERRGEITALLNKHRGVVSDVAVEMGLSPQSVYKRLAKHGIDLAAYQGSGAA